MPFLFMYFSKSWEEYGGPPSVISTSMLLRSLVIGSSCGCGPAGVLADLHHQVLGELVDEGVQVVLLADRALVVGVHPLPWAIREQGGLERLLPGPRHGGKTRPAGTHELVHEVPHPREPAGLPEQP